MARKKSTKKKSAAKKQVETLTHDQERRTNIPTAELESVMEKDQQRPTPVHYSRPNPGPEMQQAIDQRDRDLDPQLVWRGKDTPTPGPSAKADGADPDRLAVQAPPLFIQEKVHPKVLIDDLRRQTEAVEIARKLADPAAQAASPEDQLDLFADFNGIPDHAEAKTEFYQHDANWTNRMILGDSLAVMASLAEREGLRGKVQCIYLDPPYGIRFNSNFQWSTTSRDVKDGKADHITREPEQVKAFRDTWRDGIHSYLTYLRDRLTVARDLLHDTGSIFVQIGDENVHRVRAVMDEVFGDSSFIALIPFTKGAAGLSAANQINARLDYILWYAKHPSDLKFRPLFEKKDQDLGSWIELPDTTRRRLTREERAGDEALPSDAKLLDDVDLTKPGPGAKYEVEFEGKVFVSGKRWWGTPKESMHRLIRSGKVMHVGKRLRIARYLEDFAYSQLDNLWTGFGGQKNPTYVVQTNVSIVQRCLLMATDPGDLVLDPTCGSGTTAYVAEQWGRRWITIDTSRVSLALARARIMGARYPFYLLADSPEGVEKEAEITRTDLPTDPTSRASGGREGAGSDAAAGNPLTDVRGSSGQGSLRQGFVYERVPHITLKSIANNAEIDVIHERFQQRLEPLREQLNAALGTSWEEWEIPRDLEEAHTEAQGRKAEKGLSDNLCALASLREIPKTAADAHAKWWEQRIARQKEIDASIAARADAEYLYDKPYEDKGKVRVAGPFTVESLSPHRTLWVDEDDELIDPLDEPRGEPASAGGDATADAEGRTGFVEMVLENLKTAGVQQAHKEDKINLTSLAPWPGTYIAAEGRYEESDGREKRAGILIGPEFGTVARQDLVEAAREAGDADFDVLIACAFNFEAHASEFHKLGRIPILKARMNADLHMAGELKQTNKANLFVVFGEPDIEILPPADAPEDADVAGYEAIRVRLNGVDVFKPQTGEVESGGPDDIACWFIDSDYNGQSFFVRQAYFLGASDPYKALKTTLKAEINEEAWETLHSTVSRAFSKPEDGRIAVKVINHLGDEVMKVFRVE